MMDTNKKAILEYIKESLEDGELPEDFSLPKEDEGGLVFAEGAMDGIYLYHMLPQELTKENYDVLSEAVNCVGKREFKAADVMFGRLSKSHRAIEVRDAICNYIWDNRENLKAGNLYEYSIAAIALSSDVEHIKIALIILGMLNTNNEELKEDIRTLALSDEFTWYCMRIMDKWPKGNADIFEVAKRVHGWGRIHAVEVLRPLIPQSDEIREWMLKEGINNNVMPFYSALTVWREANIGSILFVNPTREELLYIGRIIDAMMDESAAPGLSTLDKRKEILLKYFEKAEDLSLSDEEYGIIEHIREYAEQTDLPEVVQAAKEKLAERHK